jgi:hypothetical protein
MLAFRMARKRWLLHVLAAVVMTATFAVPSLAVAHEGHAHYATAVEKAPAPASWQTQAHKHAADSAAPASAASLITAPAMDARQGRASDDCAGHCCGGVAGMACCGAALAPDIICVELFRASVSFVMAPDLPPSGLPPEALPKPPKSFA